MGRVSWAKELASFFSPVLGSLSPTQTSEPARRLDINKCCYFCDNNLPVGAVIPLITVTENKDFASKSCSTDYLKLEAASRFKNAMMN